MSKAKLETDNDELPVYKQPYIMVRMPPAERDAFKAIAKSAGESQQSLAKKAIVKGLSRLGYKLQG